MKKNAHKLKLKVCELWTLWAIIELHLQYTVGDN